MDFWNVVAAAAAVVSIATVAGFGLQRGYTTSLKEQLTSAREQIEAQRIQIEDLQSARTIDRAVITRQAGEIRVLQGVVTGEVHWQSISDLLEHHHTTAEEHRVKTEEVLSEILNTLREAS